MAMNPGGSGTQAVAIVERNPSSEGRAPHWPLLELRERDLVVAFAVHAVEDLLDVVEVQVEVEQHELELLKVDRPAVV